jgi:hypothetical protein
MCLEDPNTGERREVTAEDEFYTLRWLGWKWILQRDDHLEMLHLQAWYFQVRHFPRLSWVRWRHRTESISSRVTEAWRGSPTAMPIPHQPRSGIQLRKS